jgi:hypothetical protein
MVAVIALHSWKEDSLCPRISLTSRTNPLILIRIDVPLNLQDPHPNRPGAIATTDLHNQTVGTGELLWHIGLGSIDFQSASNKNALRWSHAAFT